MSYAILTRSVQSTQGRHRTRHHQGPYWACVTLGHTVHHAIYNNMPSSLYLLRQLSHLPIWVRFKLVTGVFTSPLAKLCHPLGDLYKCLSCFFSSVYGVLSAFAAQIRLVNNRRITDWRSDNTLTQPKRNC